MRPAPGAAEAGLAAVRYGARVTAPVRETFGLSCGARMQEEGKRGSCGHKRRVERTGTAQKWYGRLCARS